MNQFNPTDIQNHSEGVFIQIIPNHVYITIDSPGSGRNPVPGDFVTLRQQTINRNMVVAQGRRSYIFGRNLLIQGLQVGLAFVSQGMKGRFHFSAQFAYGSQETYKISANESIFMNFEVYSISQNPQNCCSWQEIFSQLVYVSKQADQEANLGNWYKCKKLYTKAMLLIPIQRLHMKKYSKMRQTMMLIHIKAIEVCIIVRDYYQAIIWCQKYANYQGKFKDPRCMVARAKAYCQIGQFQLAQNNLNELLMMKPQMKIAKSLLIKVLQKKNRLIQMGYRQQKDLLPIQTQFCPNSQENNYQRYIRKMKQQLKGRQVSQNDRKIGTQQDLNFEKSVSKARQLKNQDKEQNNLQNMQILKVRQKDEKITVFQQQELKENIKQQYCRSDNETQQKLIKYQRENFKQQYSDSEDDIQCL